MIIETLEVRNWKRLKHALLEGMSERINLIAGPNESGKSTLVEALRYALFEPYKGGGESKERIQPWGSGESPEVRLVLRVGSATWELRKRFLKGANALLVGPSRTLRDEDAEQALQGLVGAKGRGRGGLRLEDQGLWPLLLVEQGGSRKAPHADLSDESRARLQATVAASVGDLTGGADAARWLERAREEARRYWSASGKQEVQELERASRALAEAEAAAVVARQRRDEVHELADKISAAEERERRVRGELAGVSERARAAAEASARVQAVDAQLATLAAEAETRGLRVEAARRDRELAGRLDERIAETTTALERATPGVERATERVEEAARTRSAADDALVRAEQAEGEAREADRVARRAAERGPLVEKQASLRATVEQAEAIDVELAALRKQIANNPVDAAGLEKLRTLEADLRAAEGRLEGAAARVRVTALRDTTVDGQALPKDDVRSFVVAGPQTIRVGEEAVLSIEPGGADLPAWREKRAKAAAALIAQREKLRVETLAEAERLGAEKAGHVARVRPLEDARARLVPQGLEAARAELQALEGRIAELGAFDAPDPLQAEAALDAATGASRAAREAQKAATSAWTAAREELARQRQEHDRLLTELGRLRDERAALPALDALDAALHERMTAHGDVVVQRAALVQERQARGGDEALAAAERLARALANQRQELDELRLRIADLRGRLESQGGLGAHEALLDAETNLTTARDTHARIRRKAEAARALLNALLTARAAAHERLAAPVVQRIDPYLRMVFAGSDLDLDAEKWALRGLRTRGIEEPFDALSGGAQEQVATLVRLALAEVLAGDERLPIVLDDALVNTDEDRRRRMLSVLDRASKSLQLLVFTCHPEAFGDLGEGRRYTLDGTR